MMKSISILIPTYNHVCVLLVTQLLQQASIAGINCEIIVADDGSTDKQSVAENQVINTMPHAKYIIRPNNVGRAAIRNFLAQQSHLPHLLFIDSDMIICSDDFLLKYATTEEDAIYDGGIIVRGDVKKLKNNLRYLYEKNAESEHVTEKRNLHPYQHLHTANLMIPRQTMLKYPYDERFRKYGFEDVLLGKSFYLNHVPIYHINNPMSFEIFESNSVFLEKTEEGLHTLWEFSEDLRGYSHLLTLANYLQRRHLAPIVRIWHKFFGKLERHNLSGPSPCLHLFNLYKVGYYMQLKKKNGNKHQQILIK